MTGALLDIADLRIRFAGAGEAVRGIGFALGRERLGIVGETGSGKSLTARAILKLLPHGAAMSAARLAFDGIDLLAAGERAMRALRGRRLGLILQDPRFSLNPAMSIGRQIEEACRAHRRMSRREARDKALALLEAVRIREPRRVHALYPHQVSGGMGQRAMIAMMLAPDPDLLIADEPTSALDVTVQGQVLSVLDDEVSRRGMGLILISHDLALVRSFCNRVLVMRRGEIVESCAAAALVSTRDPYTRRLLAAQAALAP
ncbi:MAG TPA: ABC transporter ATP-binding protein [Stellaceae bacterium]|nr:ABC transporter ATP-binding protein [Stellaceae bacterium]